MSETSRVVPEVLLELSSHGITPFRQNVGTGWVGTGKPIRVSHPTTVMLRPGDIVLRGPCRPLRAGLVEGSSDIIGWRSVVITESMLGSTLAQFTAVECKTDTGRLSPAQRNFLYQVMNAGGLSGVARSRDDARRIATSIPG